jgi:hypothetical protein
MKANVQSSQELTVTAHHEAGHIVVAVLVDQGLVRPSTIRSDGTCLGRAGVRALPLEHVIEPLRRTALLSARSDGVFESARQYAAMNLAGLVAEVYLEHEDALNEEVMFRCGDLSQRFSPVPPFLDPAAGITASRVGAAANGRHHVSDGGLFLELCDAVGWSEEQARDFFEDVTTFIVGFYRRGGWGVVERVATELLARQTLPASDATRLVEEAPQSRMLFREAKARTRSSAVCPVCQNALWYRWRGRGAMYCSKRCCDFAAYRRAGARRTRA